MDFQELSYKITGACFDISHELGTGFLEKVYEAALVKELKNRGLNTLRQEPVTVFYKGEPLDVDYRADLIVEGTVIIELKVVKELADVHKAQLLNYMKATHIRYGMLINFGTPRVEIERLIKD